MLRVENMADIHRDMHSVKMLSEGIILKLRLEHL